MANYASDFSAITRAPISYITNIVNKNYVLATLNNIPSSGTSVTRPTTGQLFPRGITYKY